MPFFRRKTDKNQAGNSGSQKTSTVKRTPSSVSTGSSTGLGSPDSNGGPPVLLLSDDFEERGDLEPQSPMRTTSRLSKALTEIIHDRDALPLFISFMETKKADHFIRFWLDAESFQIATLTRKRTQSFKSGSSTSLSNQQNQTSKSNLENVEENCNREGANGQKIPDSVVQASENSGKIESHHEVVVGEGENINKPSEQNPGCVDIESNKSDTENSGVNERLTKTQDEDGDTSVQLSQSAINPNSSESSCDKTGVKNRHLSEPNASDKTNENSGSSPKHRHASESNIPTSVEVNETRKPKPSLSIEELKEKLKKSIERDAVNIFTKYISQDATHPIGVSDELRNETISYICREDGEVDPTCFTKCQKFAVDVMQKNYFPAFQGSEYHCKHQVDILTSGKVYLADILYNEMALFYLTEFLEQEDASHLLQFWMAVDNFQQHLASQQGKYDGMQAQSDAMVFYDKYFSLQASQPLGFDDKTRFEVESNICREEGPLPDVFSKPKDIVLRTLDKVYFEHFLKSEMYYKYLSDLISTVNMAQDLPTKRKRTGSDASSEHSGGSQSVGADSLSSHKNTLLAMDSSSIKKALNKLDIDMRIDNQLLNPEELWKRPVEKKMSLGSVNDYGQFVSEFTREPDHKEKKALFFKKSRTKEKEQEEMALQIAQMILNDVATMTKTGDLCSGKDNPSTSAKPDKQKQHKL
ncbi:A-kinase anchor protein 10, mitochondrial isoform X2 [Patella vulgata]|uniref:A-kinase anchor protein 10, mitochondrial isoform X2 n=1 Tax=Patella vulgata TaxID=6465 RepID=UPI00217FF3E5|nr:A-kinase anchor protein 10, mitochondrial isoform X2 [Patella vulgata]